MINALKTYHWIRQGLASSRWPIERLRQQQERRLRLLLEHAYQNVPLYRALYDRGGFRPEHFCSMDDLRRIPLLEKSDLKDTPADQLVIRGVDPRQCEVVCTSGSTGRPLRIYLRPHDQAWQRAVAWRILFEHGFHWTDRTLDIRHTHGPTYFVQRLGIASKDWIPILDSPESWARILAEKKHETIMASASSLSALAEAVQQMRLTVRTPKLILSDSESLTTSARRLIHRALGVDPIDVYGLVELSNFAWECERREGFHVSVDSHVVEVDAPPGEVGSLVATDLGMWTMPIIRYNTGDMAEMDPAPCSCGRTLPKLALIHGRETDSVILPDGKRVYWPFFHEVLAKHEDLSQGRIIQDDLHSLTLQLAIPAEKAQTILRIKTEIEEVLPSSVQLRVERLDAIPIKPGEKPRLVSSRVSMNPSVNVIPEEHNP
jgi:phenylacetate-CoA ligase